MAILIRRGSELDEGQEEWNEELNSNVGKRKRTIIATKIVRYLIAAVSRGVNTGKGQARR